MDRPINGIWFNTTTRRVLRVNSPYWKDEVAQSHWVMVTPDVNATLLHVRELIAERGLCDEPSSVTWV